MIPLTLSYQRINLTQNPFGSLNPLAQTKLAIIDSQLLNHTLIPSFNRPNHILQLLAPQGHGKTTHLLILHTYYSDIPYAQRFEQRSDARSDALQAGKHHFVDSMENVSLLQRCAIYYRYSTLAVTSTKNFEREMRLFGKQVTTVPIGVTSAQQLLALFNQRIRYFKRSAGSIPQITLADVLHLQTLFGADIRSMQNVLYDSISRLDKRQMSIYQLSALIQSLV